jgi:hypothetical protein
MLLIALAVAGKWLGIRNPLIAAARNSAPHVFGTPLAFISPSRVAVSFAIGVFQETSSAASWTTTMRRKIGDVSRKRRLRGDTRAHWYAVHRTTRFSRRLMTTFWIEQNKAEAIATAVGNNLAFDYWGEP